MSERYRAVGWNLRSAFRVAGWFATSRGEQVLRVAKALFRRLGLEVEELDGNRPGGAWFFDPDGITVSELKWKVWSAIAIHLLHCPVPDAAIGFLIASDYFWRHLPHDQDREAYRERHYFVSTKGDYVARKFTKEFSGDVVETTSEEEIVARLEKVVERLPSPRLPQTRLLNAICLFDCTPVVVDLVLVWLLFQLGSSNKRSFKWLAALECRAADPNRDDLGKLIFFFLHRLCKYDPPDASQTLALAQILSTNMSSVDWNGFDMDLTAGVRQVLQELLEAQASGCLTYGDHERLKHWILDHSQIHAIYTNSVSSHIYRKIDMSVHVARLLYSWSKTVKGQRDLEELKQLCNAGDSGDFDFVMHVKSTVNAGNDQCRAALHSAAAAVFGDKFSGQFVTMCAHVHWGHEWTCTAKCLEIEELEEFKEMVMQRGVFTVNNPFSHEPVNTNWLGDMVLYLVHLVLEDRIHQSVNDRQTWIQDAQELLVSHPRFDIPMSATDVDDFQGFIFTEIYTLNFCQEFEAWLYSPSTAEEMEASVEEMNSMMKKAVLNGGTQHSKAGQALIAKMARLWDKEESHMYGSIITYVRHGMENASASYLVTSQETSRGKAGRSRAGSFRSPLMLHREKKQRCKAMSKRRCCEQSRSVSRYLSPLLR